MTAGLPRGVARLVWSLVGMLTVVAAAGEPASGQLVLGVKGATVFESYELKPDLDSLVGGISELAVPLTVSARVGGRSVVTLSTGYARVSVRGADSDVSHISGLLDTQLRVEVQALRDRVTVFMTSSFPTGIAALEPVQVPLLGVLASDVIGFTAPNLGTGGTVGGGVAVAVPLGRMALGLASSFSTSGTYQPIQGQPGDFRPGAELRLRVGLEGPVARRSFLRLSGILAHRGDDEVNGVRHPSIGNRLSGYLSLEQGMGSGTLVLWAFDMFRFDAGLEQTLGGPTILNRGNVFVAGAQWAIPVAAGTSVTPRLEVRDSRSEIGGGDTGLQHLGTTTRFGLDVRRQLSRRIAGVVRGEGLVGSVGHTDMDGTADLKGYRLSLQLELQ